MCSSDLQDAGHADFGGGLVVRAGELRVDALRQRGIHGAGQIAQALARAVDMLLAAAQQPGLRLGQAGGQFRQNRHGHLGGGGGHPLQRRAIRQPDRRGLPEVRVGPVPRPEEARGGRRFLTRSSAVIRA